MGFGHIIIDTMNGIGQKTLPTIKLSLLFCTDDNRSTRLKPGGLGGKWRALEASLPELSKLGLDNVEAQVYQWKPTRKSSVELPNVERGKKWHARTCHGRCMQAQPCATTGVLRRGR